MVENKNSISPTAFQSDDVNALSAGSRWLRWDPHIHAPGTLLNDQFGGQDHFHEYLDKLESSKPTVRALGVTDYYSLSTYKAVRDAKLEGRLRQCDFIFPNVEMRLAIGTTRGSFVNIHLLICPDDENHIEETLRFMRQIKFEAFQETFCCTEEDLIKLGQAADPSTTDLVSALKKGANQFKVTLSELKAAFKNSNRWAEQNILIAVAGNDGDGSSGVRDAADETLRQEIDEFAHIIFSATPKQRDFWLGRGDMTPEEIKSRYRALKPCLHGSDAHDLEKVAVPDLDRYCWIKGIPSFDTLRQACIEPEGRTYIGEKPPIRTYPSQAISSVKITGASWAKRSSISLNSGLVAVIGPRGSGKTALVELIAAGCEALPSNLHEEAFLRKAKSELMGARVHLEWGGDAGNAYETKLDNLVAGSTSYPKARYLSQQFVEELCSSDNVGDKLLSEVERVIFLAHDINQKEGTTSFDELLNLRASRHRANRAREAENLVALAEQIGKELDKHRSVNGLVSQIAEKKVLISRYNSDRNKIIPKGSSKESVRLGELSVAAESARSYVRYYSSQAQSLQAVNDEVKNIRNVVAPKNLSGMQERHGASGIKSEDWPAFLMKFSGNVDELIQRQMNQAKQRFESWNGIIPEAVNNTTPLIPDDAELNELPLALLETEIKRLQNLISADKQVTERYKAISKKISEENTFLNSMIEKHNDCEGAAKRLEDLRKKRDETYKKVFDALLQEENVLKDLYAPMMNKLQNSKGTLSKISFKVERVADANKWATVGEDLLDLRTGPFKGTGTLESKAQAMKNVWETGTSEEVLQVMNEFRQNNQTGLLESSPVSKDNTAEYREWAMKFSKWLYSTDHIEIVYSVDYEDVKIQKLSPGTRGIVLLLLYLALDDADDRPLIIDQPEDNLDPKSIYDELVSLFIAAKGKRQVIMVTHNANLVINTDADQIIIASSGQRSVTGMPKITYKSGGLEEEYIRKEVCNILEGGEEAFKERARRLRVNIER